MPEAASRSSADGLGPAAASRIRLGIISHQPIAGSMSGPAIRCWEFARALAGEADVTLFAPAHDLEPEGFRLETYAGNDLVKKTGNCNVLLAQGFILSQYPQLRRPGRYLIVDVYVPMTLEALPQYEHAGLAEQNRVQESILEAIFDQLGCGHFFICASERQRDFWLGCLTAAGRITPAAFRQDPSLRRLIDVVPFGLPDKPPVATGRVLKGIHPAIGENDKVLLWGGGIYNWLDPLTPIRAMAILAKKRSDIKLFFLGARHPDPHVPRMKAYDEAIALSRELRLIDRSVIFNDHWVPYNERVNYLLEADLGAGGNYPHIETRFAFRTRILDCIWASLPVVTAGGDSLSDLIERHGLGLVTPSGDAQAYAYAVERLVDDDGLRERCRQQLKDAAKEFVWSQVTLPLKQFLSSLGPLPAEPVARIGNFGYSGHLARPGFFSRNARRARRVWRRLLGR